MVVRPQNPFAIYYCMECLSVGELDESGRCATCDSLAVWEVEEKVRETIFTLKLAEEGITNA